MPVASPTQGERLVEAMIELSSRQGYQRVTVAHLSTRAGVSSATFYELFESKEECLLAAYRAVASRVFSEMDRDLAAGEPGDGLRLALGFLLRSVQREPDAGRVLFIEALGGGPRLHEAVRQVLREFEGRAERFLSHPPGGHPLLDVPAAALVGAVRSIIARHLRVHSEDRLPHLLEDMLRWMGSYAIEPGQARWSAGPQALLSRLPAPSPLDPSAGGAEDPTAPTRLPRGRHGLPASVVARSQRTRIIHGTAEVMMAKGYAKATVTDIVAAAGVAREAFYRHFTDKQHAFLEAQHHPTQFILDACVASYFSQDRWPERIWSGLKTLLELIAQNPAQSYLRLVECYAAGPASARRAEEITRSFGVFLEEGFGYRNEARELPRLCTQTISGALFEVIQRGVARGETAELPRYLPQLTYIAIAPFTGPAEAVRLLEDLCGRDPGMGTARP